MPAETLENPRIVGEVWDNESGPRGAGNTIEGLTSTFRLGSHVMADSQPTSVYQYFDSDGVLLYVGVTGRRSTRQSEHRADKEWWRFVARQEIEHYHSRSDALGRESSLISSLCPPFNTAHNPHLTTRDAYLAMVATGEPETKDRKRLPLMVCSSTDDWVIVRTLAEHARLTSGITWASHFDVSAERRSVKDVRLARVGAAVVIHIRVSGAADFRSGELMVRKLPNGPEVKRVDLSTADATPAHALGDPRRENAPQKPSTTTRRSKP